MYIKVRGGSYKGSKWSQLDVDLQLSGSLLTLLRGLPFTNASFCPFAALVPSFPPSHSSSNRICRVLFTILNYLLLPKSLSPPHHWSRQLTKAQKCLHRVTQVAAKCPQ